jgi:hypothetical protein
VGGWEKFQKQKKKKLGGDRGENKVPKTKIEMRGKKKVGRGQGENKVAKKKLRSGLRKGKEKKLTWEGTGIEKRILSVHHPSPLVHWWVLVHSGPIS